MNSVVWYAVLACIAGIQAFPSLPPLPVNPGGIGGLFRGPNSETIIKGPDGSQIVSEQLGGAVETEARLQPIIVPDDAGDQIAVPSISTDPVEAINIDQEISALPPAGYPINSHLEIQAVHPALPVDTPQVVPIVSHSEEPHIIETELVDAPEIEPDQSSDLKGPSGSISVRGSSSIVSGPASTTISEPVRKIHLATVPVQPVIAQPQYVNSVAIAPISAVALPAPSPSLPTDLVPPPREEISLTRLEEIGIRDTVLRTDLVPPPISPSNGAPPIFYNGNSASANARVDVPLISLTGTSGAGIADATLRTDLTPPHITIISSTQAPPIQLSTQNSIDLGQTVISSTSSIPSPNSVTASDVDASRINLGQSNSQAVEVSNVPPSWTAPSIGGSNIIYSNISPVLPLSPPIHTGIPNRPLLITAAELQRVSNSASSTGSISSNIIRQSDAINEQVGVQDQTPRYTNQGASQIINQQPQIDTTSPNIQGTTWLNVQPSQNLPPTISNDLAGKNYGTPIPSVLDSVFVQPTDPRNREVIEFGGKQLENVGNIVPVIQHPVLVTGDLRNFQQIPTASISQLSSRNELDPSISSRYGRNALKQNDGFEWKMKHL
ncbi:hypothetical protein WA026_009537 [Henosepilachna vigintioctopunctata]|uniref:Uncharacterized protein n=1 Tax=Henosepilachna vigintioctopunctata TaxID=420089 RepID=A0AAW1TZN9_9CUCU